VIEVCWPGIRSESAEEGKADVPPAVRQPTYSSQAAHTVIAGSIYKQSFACGDHGRAGAAAKSQALRPHVPGMRHGRIDTALTSDRGAAMDVSRLACLDHGTRTSCDTH